MEKTNVGKDLSGSKHRPVDQGGHKGLGGHGGQQSGGMGGMHGGDLHDIGSGHSGMTGRGGVGGNNNDHHQSGGDAGAQSGNEQRAEAGGHEAAEIQQSAQREGMGQHRHRGRDSAHAIDATDKEDLGSRDSAAPAAELDKPAE